MAGLAPKKGAPPGWVPMHHPRVPVHKSVTQSAQSDRPPTLEALEARARAAEAELLAIEEEPKATSKAKNKRPSYWAHWSLVFLF